MSGAGLSELLPKALPELGVGIIYSSALDELIRRRPDLVQVVEIEPQTVWMESGRADEPYILKPEVSEELQSIPARKLIHSVGTPVGGSVRANAAQIPLLRQMVESLGAPWASEHLSFNLTPDHFTGFFLPPRQTDSGIEIYSHAVAELRQGLGVPVAAETGVNYLRPRADEIPDGEFMARLAERADCGILLDLHNVYCNARNGRQSVDRFLSELPLERVWEVHLAGGFEMDGFWLDSHSGAIPDALFEICRDVIPALPNVKAINFEMFSSFLSRFGLENVERELERIQVLWELRRTGTSRLRVRASGSPVGGPSVTEWERELGGVVNGRQATEEWSATLAEEAGVRLTAGLIKEFRGSMLVNVYRMTCRLMMLALGPDVFRAILEDFWSTTPPKQFAVSEAEAFARFLEEKKFRLPQLHSILNFERATIATLQDGQPRIAKFSLDPLPMLRALADGVLLENPGTPGDYEIEVVPETAIRIAEYTDSN